MSKVANVEYSPAVFLQRKLEEIVVRNLAFDQVESYPWVSEKILDMFGVDKSKLYSIQNPVVPDCPWMRDSMLYNLLSICAKNSKFFEDFRIFDIGRIRDK